MTPKRVDFHSDAWGEYASVKSLDRFIKHTVFMLYNMQSSTAPCAYIAHFLFR